MADEAGEVVSCPGCGAEVKQKAMIPVLAEAGTGHRYLCRECARALIPTDDGDAAHDAAAGNESSAPAPEAVAPTGGASDPQD